MTPPKVLYLCGAPQSSGSTLVSWCFLQRADMDGVLDARTDLLPELPPGLSTALAWCKFTISSFRLLDAVRHFEDAGLTVRPLLVVRDPRAVFDSLITKSYGRNGITAEDPPLRLRLRRFHEDFKHARTKGWPVIGFESFAADPEQTLRRACDELALPWDPGMLTWPKTADQISSPRHGNKTFRASRGRNVRETIKGDRSTAWGTTHTPLEDLRWIEGELADWISAMDYAPHVDAGACPPGRAVPSLDNSRRGRHDRKPLVRLRNAGRRILRQLRGTAPGAAPPAGRVRPSSADADH